MDQLNGLAAILNTWSPYAPAMIASAVLAVMFYLFFTEKYAAPTVAFLGMVALLVTGFLSLDEILKSIANPAPWTIAAMFILSAALVRSGVLNMVSRLLSEKVKSYPRLVIVSGAGLVLFLSAFMNNTPVVVVLMPIVIKLAADLGRPASKFLMPLSYFAIIGGMLTLIGTSTNLLVDGIARQEGIEGFHIFDVTPLALIIAAFASIYIFVASRYFIPTRASMAEMLVNRKKMSFFTEVAIPSGSPVIGRNVMDVDLFQHEGMRVIDVLRGDESLRRGFPEIMLEDGDRIVLRTGVNELLGLKQSRALHMVDQLSSKKTTTIEALISPGCRMVGRSLGALRLRRRYGVYPLAVHRSAQNMGRQLDDIIIRVGDTLLLEGTPEDIHRLSTDMNMVELSESTERPYQRRHAPLVVAAWVFVILAASLNIIPIIMAAMIAIAVVLVTKAIEVEEALEAIDGGLLMLIFSMLAVGQGLANSGAISMLATGIAPYLALLPAPLMIWVLFLMTSILTELVSNNAVAVVMTPVAIGLAASIGVDPRPLVVAVMIAASASFATPIGYQTNTMVYGPGGYEFKDFLKVGTPLNFSIGVLSAILIPLFFPL